MSTQRREQSSSRGRDRPNCLPHATNTGGGHSCARSLLLYRRPWGGKRYQPKRKVQLVYSLATAQRAAAYLGSQNAYKFTGGLFLGRKKAFSSAFKDRKWQSGWPAALQQPRSRAEKEASVGGHTAARAIAARVSTRAAQAASSSSRTSAASPSRSPQIPSAISDSRSASSASVSTQRRSSARAAASTRASNPASPRTRAPAHAITCSRTAAASAAAGGSGLGAACCEEGSQSGPCGVSAGRGE